MHEKFFWVLLAIVVALIAITTSYTLRIAELEDKVEILELRLEWGVEEELPDPQWGLREESVGYSPR